MSEPSYFASAEDLHSTALQIVRVIRSNKLLDSLDRDQMLEAVDEAFNLPEFFTMETCYV